MKRHVNSAGNGRQRGGVGVDPDLYVVLGVRQDATADEIHKAYRRRSREVQQRGREREAEEVARAYKVLRDRRQREIYDRQRRRMMAAEDDSEEDYEAYDSEEEAKEEEAAAAAPARVGGGGGGELSDILRDILVDDGSDGDGSARMALLKAILMDRFRDRGARGAAQTGGEGK